MPLYKEEPFGQRTTVVNSRNHVCHSTLKPLTLILSLHTAHTPLLECLHDRIPRKLNVHHVDEEYCRRCWPYCYCWMRPIIRFIFFRKTYRINLITFNFCISIGIYLQDSTKSSKFSIYWPCFGDEIANSHKNSEKSVPILREYNFKVSKQLSYFTCIAFRFKWSKNIVHLFYCIR